MRPNHKITRLGLTLTLRTEFSNGSAKNYVFNLSNTVANVQGISILLKDGLTEAAFNPSMVERFTNNGQDIEMNAGNALGLINNAIGQVASDGAYTTEPFIDNIESGQTRLYLALQNVVFSWSSGATGYVLITSGNGGTTIQADAGEPLPSFDISSGIGWLQIDATNLSGVLYANGKIITANPYAPTLTKFAFGVAPIEFTGGGATDEWVLTYRYDLTDMLASSAQTQMNWSWKFYETGQNSITAEDSGSSVDDGDVQQAFSAQGAGVYVAECTYIFSDGASLKTIRVIEVENAGIWKEKQWLSIGGFNITNISGVHLEGEGDYETYQAFDEEAGLLYFLRGTNNIYKTIAADATLDHDISGVKATSLFCATLLTSSEWGNVAPIAYAYASASFTTNWAQELE